MGSSNWNRTLFLFFRKQVSCLTFSSDGNYIAVGECGHQPCVRIWSVSSREVVSQLVSHHFGIACLVSAICHTPCTHPSQPHPLHTPISTTPLAHTHLYHTPCTHPSQPHPLHTPISTTPLAHTHLYHTPISIPTSSIIPNDRPFHQTSSFWFPLDTNTTCKLFCGTGRMVLSWLATKCLQR